MKTDQCKSPGNFRLLSVGDIHLGHPQTPTELIIRNLDRYCTNEVVLKDVDLLIITGDLFDRLLHNADDNVTLIQRWITRLLYKCSYLNVAVRVLEGTPSHDRGQSRFFIEQQQNANIPLDLHYASTLSIETHERWGITILYVPDKWRSDTSETLAEARALLHRHQLQQVDYAIMHGAFEHQLPAVVTEPMHSSAEYLALVKYYILIGHVHFMTQKERILAAGSFDRLCHGEEGAKGYFDVTVRDSGNNSIVFIENKGAKRYDSIPCHGMDMREINVLLKKRVSKLPKGSALRIRCDPNDPVSGDLDSIKQQYPEYQWTLLVEKPKKTKTSVAQVFKDLDLMEFVEITPENVQELIAPELLRFAKDDATRERCRQRLNEVI